MSSVSCIRRISRLGTHETLRALFLLVNPCQGMIAISPSSSSSFFFFLFIYIYIYIFRCRQVADLHNLKYYFPCLVLVQNIACSNIITTECALLVLPGILTIRQLGDTACHILVRVLALVYLRTTSMSAELKARSIARGFEGIFPSLMQNLS